MKKIGNNASFAKFYIKDQIYIDKTETIYNLLDNEDRIFISRPRRFGKSLTLDILLQPNLKKTLSHTSKELGYMINGRYHLCCLKIKSSVISKK
ncbi:MAG: AAA family ATPase [Succinatimonas sp.]|nr:AAA family ATPase [Succinatimonas sp.]